MKGRSLLGGGVWGAVAIGLGASAVEGLWPTKGCAVAFGGTGSSTASPSRDVASEVAALPPQRSAPFAVLLEEPFVPEDGDGVELPCATAPCCCRLRCVRFSLIARGDGN